MRIFRLFLLFFIVLGSGGAAMAAYIPIELSGKNHPPVRFMVERAQTEEERAKGLMHRYRLPENEGMLFYLPSYQKAQMWMKDTYIPLDMIFFSDDNVVTEVYANAQPESMSIITSQKKSLYVLEVGGGIATKNKIQVGDVLTFPAR